MFTNHLIDMLRASAVVPINCVDDLDGFLYENYESPWSLVINHITGETVLIGYFSNSSECSFYQSQLIKEFISRFEPDFNLETINDEDWKNSYKIHFQPWSYKGFNLIPLWLKDTHSVPEYEIALYLDPGMAFGTGNHETTRMCMEFMLDDYEAGGNFGNFIDLGCGSGILSILASLLGAKSVVGVDNDADATRISSENSVINGVDRSVVFFNQSLNKLNLPLNHYDYIVANIQADVLINHTRQLLGIVSPNSKLILSGILTNEVENVVQSFKNESEHIGPFLSFTKEQGEWTSLKISWDV